MYQHSSGFDQARESLRLQQIYNTISRYGLDMVFDRGLVGRFRRRMQRFIYRPGQPIEPLARPVKVRLLMQELGPTYVKMGQIISSRSQTLPPGWCEELSRLQNNVAPFSSEEVRTIIQTELGDAPERLYAEFSPTPFAAASTAQVHRARLADGTPVVVKVQRPNIRPQMKADVGVMVNLSSFLEGRLQYARDADLSGMVQEFGDGIIRELDLGSELYNMKRLARNMENISGVSVPKAYPELSSSKVLTMEFMQGVKITNVEAIQAADLVCNAIGEIILRALVKQLLIDGFFHADPHPGNILVNLETGNVAFLDMGMMGEIDLSKRLNLINLLMVARQRDAAGMARAVRNLSVPFRKHVDEGRFYRDFERTVGRYLDPTTEPSFGELMAVIFNLLSAHGLRLDSDLTLAIKAMMQAEAIYNALYPEGGGLIDQGFNITKEMILQEATADNIKIALTRQGSVLLQDAARHLPSVQEATLRWLNMYRRGRFELVVDTSDLSTQVRSLRRIAQQVIVGIVLVGIIIGSAIAASFSSGSTVLTQLTEWALVAYFASTIVGGILVVVVLYHLLFRRDSDEA
jgi:ubiquinone biosynthesis protein